jgi:hypothetical protein
LILSSKSNLPSSRKSQFPSLRHPLRPRYLDPFSERAQAGTRTQGGRGRGLPCALRLCRAWGSPSSLLCLGEHGTENFQVPLEIGFVIPVFEMRALPVPHSLAAEVLKLDVVDRNLLIAISNRVIDMIQLECKIARTQTSGVEVNAASEAPTQQGIDDAPSQGRKALPQVLAGC